MWEGKRSLTSDLFAPSADNISFSCVKSWVPGKSDGAPEGDVRWAYSWTPTNRPWYLDGRNGTTWTAPYSWVEADGTQRTGISGCSPMKSSSGRVLGVVSMDLTMDGFSSALEDYTEDEDDLLVYIIEKSTLKLQACSDSDVLLVNATTEVQVVATESTDTRVAFSSKLLNNSGFPDGVVMVDSNYFIQSLAYSDRYGLDWLLVTVQGVDCDTGYTLGSDNQTWCVLCVRPSTNPRGWLTIWCVAV